MTSGGLCLSVAWSTSGDLCFSMVGPTSGGPCFSRCRSRADDRVSKIEYRVPWSPEAPESRFSHLCPRGPRGPLGHITTFRGRRAVQRHLCKDAACARYAYILGPARQFFPCLFRHKVGKDDAWLGTLASLGFRGARVFPMFLGGVGAFKAPCILNDHPHG